MKKIIVLVALVALVLLFGKCALDSTENVRGKIVERNAAMAAV